MRIKVGMMYDGGVPFGRAVEEHNNRWATAHGYSFVGQHALPDSSLDPYWNRIPFIRDNLDGCDWFVWLDADVLIVNSDQAIEPHLDGGKDILFSGDYNGLCCGAFAVRNCAWSRRLLDAWALLGNLGPHVFGVFDTGFMREQTTMKALQKLFPAVRSHTGHIPERVIQNMYSPYAPDALALHTWAGFTGPGMVELVLSRLQQGGYRKNLME